MRDVNLNARRVRVGVAAFIYRAGTRILRSSNQFRMTLNSVAFGSSPLRITIKNRPSSATS